MKKTRPIIAIWTPTSRTWPARSANCSSSSRRRPNSVTSRAPATLKRSVERVARSALSVIDCRVRPLSRRPTYRAGRRNTGSSTSAATVIGHDSASIAPATSTSETTFETTPLNVEVKACWAPMTSVLIRVTSAPVWARVKNATGCRCTCENTCVRRS